jgi:hypothetical protein
MNVLASVRLARAKIGVHSFDGSIPVGGTSILYPVIMKVLYTTEGTYSLTCDPNTGGCLVL